MERMSWAMNGPRLRGERRHGRVPTSFGVRGLGIAASAVLLVLVVSIGGPTLLGEEMEDGPDRPNIIIIDVDRMSRNHLPCYGYDYNTTPEICAFGRENMLFTDAVAQSGWTASSIASLFTAQYPGVHGLVNHTTRLRGDRKTLAEVLSRYGYRTAAFPGNNGSERTFLTEGYNLDQGFDTYTAGSLYVGQHRRGIRRWLDGSEDPFFLFVQGFGPHRYAWTGIHARGPTRDDNYTGILHNWEVIPFDGMPLGRMEWEHGGRVLRYPNGTGLALNEEDIDHVIAHYDQELRRTDADIGALFDLLREQGVYENSIIIVLANHGEYLNASQGVLPNNRLFGHGGVLDAEIRVPFMMRVPDTGEDRVEEQIELIDVMPTLLDAARVPVSEGMQRRMQGTSFRALYHKNASSGKTAFARNLGGNTFAVRSPPWKLVSRPHGEQSLFNISTEERRDRSAANPGIVDRLQSRLARQQLQNQILRTDLYGED